MASVVRFCKGVGFLTAIALSCLTCLVLLIPSVLVLAIPSRRLIKWRRRQADVVSGLFLDFAAALLVTLCGTKVYIYCNSSRDLLKDKGALIICNHRCRVDWMYAGWCYAAATRMTPQLRVVLKESLRSVPLFGWTMQILLYIFLERKRDADLQHIDRSIKYLLRTGDRPAVFLFPEGTDLSPTNVIKNTEYAKEVKLPEWNYVLVPKSAGLQTCLTTLQGAEAPVHDITIAYKDFKNGQRPTEKSILWGEFPKEIHLCVKRLKPDSIPTDKPMLDRWLRGSFAKKEKLLRSFYENGSCAISADVPPANSAERSPQNQSDDLWPPLVKTHIDTKRPIYVMAALIALNIASFLYFSWFRWVIYIMIVICVGIGAAAGGIDKLELLLHSDMILKDN